MKTACASLLLSALLVSGCVTTETHYKTRNGMAYCENCKAIIVTTAETEKIKLPSGGYAGASVDLGSVEKTEARGEVSRVLSVINRSIVSACEGQKFAAFANDRATYDRWAAIQQNQTEKLGQLEKVIAEGETTPPAATAAPVTVASTAEPAAVAEAPPKPAAKKNAKLKKWAWLYSAKHSGKVKLPRGTTVAKTKPAAKTGPAAAPTTARLDT